MFLIKRFNTITQSERGFIMKKYMVFSILTMLIFSQSGFSQETYKGMKLIGPRLALGSVYGASTGFGGQFEIGVNDNFIDLGEDIPTWLGIGASFMYSSYSDNYLLFTNEKFTYTNIVILGSGFFHADVLKQKNLDTYLMFSVGINAGSVKYSGSQGNVALPSFGSFVIGAGAGARYYFSPKLAAVGEVGVGLGLLRLGIDFKL